MSEVDPKPMEVYLLKICERIIKLGSDDSAENMIHLKNVTKFLTEEMGKVDQDFEKLFDCVVPAGSYPDNLKITEPNEYDLLVVLKFPITRVAPSRPGFVTLKVKDSNYERFVDEEGCLIQNKVLNWLRSVVKKVLDKCGNGILVDDNTYELIQSSNGPAVTVTVITQYDTKFSIDFVGCLAFHSDVWWTSEKHRYSGVWNAIPKPVKETEEIKADVSIVSSKKEKVNRIFRNKKWEANEKEKKPSGESTRPRTWFRRSKKCNVQVESKNPMQVESKKPIICDNVLLQNHTIPKSRWEKSSDMKQNPSANGVCKVFTRHWINKTKKTRIKRKLESNNEKCEKSSDAIKKEAGGFSGPRKRKSTNQKDNRLKQMSCVFVPNPVENREWTCSYADIERTFLKRTENMKPLIRIFKKIRDNKGLTNLKSYYIKTIFLHQNEANDVQFWQRSLAVLFMEMLDVILKHLKDHRLDSFWHENLNLFSKFRKSQIGAMYTILLKTKRDLVSNLENGNPEYIYNVVCGEEERLSLEIY